MLIGLTGPYCSGKNYIASLLEQKGFSVLDVDTLGHEAIRREREAITARFGADILAAGTGEIDRKLLGKKVFGNQRELVALEAIVHPVANALTSEWIAARRGKNCVINAALLHRSVAFERLDAIIIVKAGFLTRLIRARKRDRLPWLDLIKRFRSQNDFSSQYVQHIQNSQKNADKKNSIYIINNTGRNLQKQLDGVVRSLIKEI
ncbi:MAG: dephospho-CoA kinase [Treponema sp.]|jgi:dephospho-CoA kinase|nr:dephospho-CoA kinase [Treponema sp.]